MQAACLRQLLRAGARDGAARAGWRHTGDKACWMSSGPWLRREVTEQRGARPPGWPPRGGVYTYALGACSRAVYAES